MHARVHAKPVQGMSALEGRLPSAACQEWARSLGKSGSTCCHAQNTSRHRTQPDPGQWMGAREWITASACVHARGAYTASHMHSHWVSPAGQTRPTAHNEDKNSLACCFCALGHSSRLSRGGKHSPTIHKQLLGVLPLQRPHPLLLKTAAAAAFGAAPAAACCGYTISRYCFHICSTRPCCPAVNARIQLSSL
jgi:hypothetical protein